MSRTVTTLACIESDFVVLSHGMYCSKFSSLNCATDVQEAGKSGPSSSSSSRAIQSAESCEQATEVGAEQRGGSGTPGPTDTHEGVVLLPRMPMGLALMADTRTYEAVATVCRTLGRLAADAGGHAMRSLVDHLLTELRTCRPGGAGLHSSDWQCSAASSVTVLSEVVYGASAAWQPRRWLASAGTF